MPLILEGVILSAPAARSGAMLLLCFTGEGFQDAADVSETYYFSFLGAPSFFASVFVSLFVSAFFSADLLSSADPLRA